MAEKTLYQKLIDRELPVWPIYEDEKFFAFLDIFPFEKGHTLVIPKKPYKTIFEIPQNEFLDLMKIVYKISNHYKEVLGCDINIHNNNGKLASQEIDHFHIHIVPRRENKQVYKLENKTKYLDNEMDIYKNRLRLQ